jgi:hypothetical protein
VQTGGSADGSAAVLLDSIGNQLGTVRLPPRTRVVSGTRDVIWAVAMDVDDMPSVVRFRVR